MSGAELIIFISCVLAIAGAVLLGLRIRNEWRKSHEPPDPQRRLLPDPLRVKQIDDDFASKNWVLSQMEELERRREERVTKVEKDLDKKLDEHQAYVKTKFNKIDKDLTDIKVEGQERGDKAIEQIEEVAEQVNETAKTLAKVGEKSENTERIVISMNQKLDRAIEREIPTKRHK